MFFGNRCGDTFRWCESGLGSYFMHFLQYLLYIILYIQGNNNQNVSVRTFVSAGTFFGSFHYQKYMTHMKYMKYMKYISSELIE